MPAPTTDEPSPPAPDADREPPLEDRGDVGPPPPAGTDAAPADARVALVPPDEVVVAPPAPAPAAAPPQGPEPAAIVPRRIVLDGDRPGEPQAPPVAGALDAHASAFAAPPGRPLLAVVLRDGGGEALAPLRALDLPLTVAIDPDAPDVARRAEALRVEGVEIVVDPPAPADGATAQDVERALAGATARVPQAIGLIDDAEDGFTERRETLAALLPALADAGMGVVVPAGGLGTAVTDARRAGVPAVALYRVLDAEGERAEVIGRYLDRAAFEAARAGAVVVLGDARPETVEAISEWAAGPGAATVALAPLSAVLRASGGVE